MVARMIKTKKAKKQRRATMHPSVAAAALRKTQIVTPVKSKSGILTICLVGL
jgi:hypothetical protein